LGSAEHEIWNFKFLLPSLVVVNQCDNYLCCFVHFSVVCSSEIQNIMWFCAKNSNAWNQW